MIARPFDRLGRAINVLMHGLVSRNPKRALRHAALLLLSIWAVFLPVLALAWFLILRRSEFPYAVLLMSMADSLLFVLFCFLGVRLRLALPVPWLRRVLMALVLLMFVPIAFVLWIQHQAPGSGEPSGLTFEVMELYYGWVFDVYIFSLMGLTAGLNGYHETVPGGRMRWTAALPHHEPLPITAVTPDAADTGAKGV